MFDIIAFAAGLVMAIYGGGVVAVIGGVLMGVVLGARLVAWAVRVAPRRMGVRR